MTRRCRCCGLAACRRVPTQHRVVRKPKPEAMPSNVSWEQAAYLQLYDDL